MQRTAKKCKTNKNLQRTANLLRNFRIFAVEFIFLQKRSETMIERKEYICTNDWQLS